MGDDVIGDTANQSITRSGVAGAAVSSRKPDTVRLCRILSSIRTGEVYLRQTAKRNSFRELKQHPPPTIRTCPCPGPTKHYAPIHTALGEGTEHRPLRNGYSLQFFFGASVYNHLGGSLRNITGWLMTSWSASMKGQRDTGWVLSVPRLCRRRQITLGIRLAVRRASNDQTRPSSQQLDHHASVRRGGGAGCSFRAELNGSSYQMIRQLSSGTLWRRWGVPKYNVMVTFWCTEISAPQNWKKLKKHHDVKFKQVRFY